MFIYQRVTSINMLFLPIQRPQRFFRGTHGVIVGHDESINGASAQRCGARQRPLPVAGEVAQPLATGEELGEGHVTWGKPGKVVKNYGKMVESEEIGQEQWWIQELARKNDGQLGNCQAKSWKRSETFLENVGFHIFHQEKWWQKCWKIGILAR